MSELNRSLGRFASFGPSVIRLMLGGLFLLHGIDKFRGGRSGVEDFVASSGVPAAGLAAPAAAVAEVLLGGALILGLFTRLAAVGLALVLVGAITWVKADGGILGSSELDLAYLAGLLGLVLLGPGRLSIDGALETDETVLDLRAPHQRPASASVGVG